MAITIRCDKCGNEIEITEAIRKELEEEIIKEIRTQYEQKLVAKDKEVQEAKEEIYKNAAEEADKIAKEAYEKKIRQAKEEALCIEKEKKDLQEEISGLIRQLRETKNSKERLEIEYQRKLLEEEGKIKQEAKKEAEDELTTRIAEKDKKLLDAEKQIKDLQRKLQQGSQQTQGEVQELAIETLLRKEFPYDEIREVPKGIRGADVMQHVCTNNGAKCGTIIWESKNTKTWSKLWISKLKQDQRSLKAEIAVLVSKTLPDNIENFAYEEGVWISDIYSAAGLACALRHQLKSLYSLNTANKGKKDKAEIVYNYLISNEFKQRIEVWVEYFLKRKEEIEKERAYFLKKWEKEEKHILNVVENTAGIYGDLQGLIGAALPKIQYLELSDDL